ncbi:helix-turn-helix domain-containing protein [Candidatus Peregrinibacteria bacterium]|nr:helix-turn-helix domain-containing protein [Candidatus Peregrinibacteria bacterium]
MKNLFQSIGADEKETKAFLKMLELGAQPISVIARYIGVPRSTMYSVLERLKKLGLIEQFEKSGILYAKCIPVSDIAGVLKTQERQIEQSLLILEENLPQLTVLENRLSITPQIKFFEGKNQTMKVYEKVLKEKEFLAVFNPKIVKRMMPEYIYKVAEVLRQNNGKAKELLVNCKEAHEYQKRFLSKNHQIKILPERIRFDSDTIICADRIYMISYGANQVCATEIINPHLAQTQRALFEFIWDIIYP